MQDFMELAKTSIENDGQSEVFMSRETFWCTFEIKNIVLHATKISPLLNSIHYMYI